jgi:serine/threonine protein kinase
LFSKDTTSNNQTQLLTFYSREKKSVNCIMIIISAVVNYIWYIPLIFRDLKLDNVLVGRDSHCKLSDFGLSKTGVFKHDRASSDCGTRLYMAPEVIIILNLNVIT